jgi:hypothetical protein
LQPADMPSSDIDMGSAPAEPPGTRQAEAQSLKTPQVLAPDVAQELQRTTTGRLPENAAYPPGTTGREKRTASPSPKPTSLKQGRGEQNDRQPTGPPITRAQVEAFRAALASTKSSLGRPTPADGQD